MPSLDETPIIDLGKTPVPGADPSGVDSAEDEQYIAVLAELGKCDRIESDEPEWFQMEQDARAVLQSKSKDFEIASALGHALFKLYSYAGLAATLGLLTEMVKGFWDNGFPARPRRRKARVEALANRFSDQGWFRDNQPKPADFDALDACVIRAEELKTALTEKLPDDEPPDFRKFIKGLKEHAGKRPKAAAPAPPPAAAAAPGAPSAAGGAEAFVAAEPGDAGGAMNAILSAATFLRKADLTDPIPYAVVRVMKWSKIMLPTTDDAKFKIPPPDKTVMEALPHQMTSGLWEILLKGAEGAFRSNDPLWLDLQRYVCAAMSGLGAPYERAREAVMGQTAALVERLGPSLFELRFNTGVPLCSGETKMWIESDVAPARGGGGEGAAMSNGKLSEASDKARKLASSGKLKEGLKELYDGLQTCTQRRERFLWKLHIARLCFEAQRLRLAAPLLEECFEEVQRFRVDEWEPTLAIGVAQTLYRCRKSLTMSEKVPSPEALERVRESFAWLCQLDPLAALAAEPSGP